ncbi:antimicrobial peptide ABC transporter ATPase [Salinisphaera sp. PC39]
MQVRDLVYAYDRRPVLRLADFALAQGEQAAVLGPSGSGKSTLLHLLAGVLSAAPGMVIVADRDWTTLAGSARDRFRGREVGLVYQRPYLIGALRVLDNLRLARYAAGLPDDADVARATLAAVGLAATARCYPHELSQGQRQRVALARALVNRPRVILADEPTANLDDANAERVLTLLRDRAAERGATLLVVTHDTRVRAAFDRRLEMAT